MGGFKCRYDIDRLRVFATCLLFVFHVGKVFDVHPYYHLKNDQLSHGLDLFGMRLRHRD